MVARTGIEPVIFTLKGPERNRVFIGFFAAFSNPCIHVALIAEGSVSYGGRRRQARYAAPVLRAANSRPTMQHTINLVDAGVAEDTVMKIGGWKTKAMFSRYNVMNTARIRAAIIQGDEFVAGRIRNAGHT